MFSNQWLSRQRQLPPLESLRVFLAAVEAGGFSKAAAQLNMTANAVAHHITKLETWFGCLLFRRHARGVEALPETLHLAEQLRRHLQALAETSETFRQRVVRPEITLTAMPSLVTKWLLPCLGGLRDKHPDLGYRIISTPALADFTLDIAQIGIREGTGSWPDLQSLLLFPEWWAPVCSAEYAREKAIRSVDDLAHVTLLHDEAWAGTPDQMMWPQWLQNNGISDMPGREALHFSHSYLALEAAMAGQGVALANLALCASDLSAGRLVAPVDGWRRGPYDFHLVWAEGGAGNAPMDQMREYLQIRAAEHLRRMEQILAESAIKPA